jgi:hypothetical protein
MTIINVLMTVLVTGAYSAILVGVESEDADVEISLTEKLETGTQERIVAAYMAGPAASIKKVGNADKSM